MKKTLILSSFLFIIFLSGCHKNNDIVQYHKFNNRIWNRFEKITFDIPILDIEKRYNVYFFAHHTKDYEYDNLEFNMIMNTPSGEERIKEYKFLLKDKTGGFTGNCTSDSCESIIPLKKGLKLEKKGMLRIEIEVLVPHLEINYLLGVGIRLEPVRQ
jgi:gliding motility-associated lipoprotein GldH